MILCVLVFVEERGVHNSHEKLLNINYFSSLYLVVFSLDQDTNVYIMKR